MTSLPMIAGALRRRAHRAVFLGELVSWTAVALLVCGTTVLLTRMVVGVSRSDAAMVFALVAVAPLLAWARASRRPLGHEDAVAWLDLHSGATGTLLTGMEAPDERWRAQVEMALRRIDARPRLRLRRPLIRVALVAAFAGLTLWVDSDARTPDPSQAFYEAAAERLREKLDTLDEIVALEQELVEEMEAQLDLLMTELEDAGADSNLEALDRLAERLGAEADRVRQSADQATLQLEALVSDAGLAAELRQRALEETLASLQELGFDRNLPQTLEEMLAGLGAQSLELPEGLTLDAEELAELAELLEDLIDSKLSYLADAGLLDPSKLQKAAEFPDLRDFQFAEHACDSECEAGGI